MGAGLSPRGAGEEGQAAHLSAPITGSQRPPHLQPPLRPLQPPAPWWGPEDGRVGPSYLAQKIMLQFSKQTFSLLCSQVSVSFKNSTNSKGISHYLGAFRPFIHLPRSHEMTDEGDCIFKVRLFGTSLEVQW